MIELFKDLKKLRMLLTRQDKWKFIFLFGLMFLGAFLEAAGIGAVPLFVSMVMKPSVLSENQWVGHWFSGLPDEPSTQVLLWISVVFFAFILFKNLFLSFVFYVQSRIVTSQQLKLGDRMFRTYLSAPYEWHLQRSTSELLRNIQSDTSQILRGVIMPFLDFSMSMIMSIVVVGVMIVSMPGPALLSFIVMGIALFLVIRLFQTQLRKIGKIVWTEQSNIIKAIQQGFGAFIDARIIGCEDYLSEVHKRSLSRQTKAQRVQFTIQKSTPNFIETIAIFGLLAILLFLMSTAETPAEILPILALLAVATIRLKQLASKIASAINQMNASRAVIPTIVEDVRQLDLIAKQYPNKTKHKINKEEFIELRLENVSYSYPDADVQALSDVSIQLKRGESIAFVGQTGCGKSTLVNIILGLLDPQSGLITLNGQNIKKNIGKWRNHLGYIPQSIYLIDDTIQANVAFGIPPNEVDQVRLQEALGSAQLSEFINTLPEGKNTVIGERGVRLSGGQRQRLGIARALYPNPGVLVMDEATSALDNKTELEVMKAIQNLKQDRTLIMIAHRLSTVEDCDRLYFFNNGKVEVSGTFEEIKKSSSSFRVMTADALV